MHKLWRHLAAVVEDCVLPIFINKIKTSKISANESLNRCGAFSNTLKEHNIEGESTLWEPSLSKFTIMVCSSLRSFLASLDSAILLENNEQMKSDTALDKKMLLSSFKMSKDFLSISEIQNKNS